MTCKIINGLSTAKTIKNQIKEYIEKNNLSPHLTIVSTGDDSSSKIYIDKKVKACKEVGIKVEVVNPLHMGEEIIKCPQDVFDSTFEKLNQSNDTDAIIVQLPASEHLDTNKIFKSINPYKDVDCVNPENVGLLSQENPRFLPCTPHGIVSLLKRNNIQIEAEKIAIINRSNIVGKPLASMLMSDAWYGNASVTVLHDRIPKEKTKEICKEADIIIVAVGIPNFLTADMVKKGAIVVDVGINRTEDGIVGDTDFHDVAEVAGYITPVPGGVGPMTVAMLLANVVRAHTMRGKANV